MSLDLKPILERADNIRYVHRWVDHGENVAYVECDICGVKTRKDYTGSDVPVCHVIPPIKTLCAEVESLRALLRRARVEMNPHASDSLGAPWELLNDIDSALPPVSP